MTRNHGPAHRLLALTSLSAMAAALAAMPVRAQQQAATSYNAPNPTIISGSVRFDRGNTPGVETYTVDSPTAVIDFTPNDTGIGGGAIAFQNAGTSVTYVNGANTQNYTILNRIVPVDPTRAVRFDGTVRSQVQQGAAAGGNVWFYSPGGIILGATAAFDVGGLLLTALDPSDGEGAIGSPISFSGGGAPGSRIVINPGASITATPEGSYVALMAPAIVQGGAVRVNGSAGYVAAEQATLTINSGLFDIVVDAGTDTSVNATATGTVIDHFGTTSGPSSLTGNRGVYMVAVPKNDAITMLVQPGGQLGFDIASGATVANGNVVLSAGYNVNNGQIDASGAALGNGNASVSISGGRFTTDVVARAKTDVLAASTTATPTFAGDVIFQARSRVLLAGRQAGTTLTVGGDTILTSDGSFAALPVPTLTGGTVSLFTDNGGSVAIGGDVTMRSDATAPTSTTGSSAVAGRALIRAIGGTIDINGGVVLSANAIGGAAGPNGTGATLTGGFAEMVAESGGTIDIAGRVRSNADAIGTLALAGVSGPSIGGQAYVRTETTGGSIILRDSVELSAMALGNSGSASGTTGGTGTGGTVYVRSQSGTIAITGDATLTGSGTGGDAADPIGDGSSGADGGNGAGGNVFVQADAGTALTFGSTVALLTDARGGANSGGGDGIGGSGTGGPANIIATGNIAISDSITISASGIGGAKIAGTGGGGGAARGGQARILGAGGTFTIGGDILIDAVAVGGYVSGGATGNGGTGRGGGARLGTTAAASTLTVSGDVDLRADGSGNDGAGAGSIGGDGIGGRLVNGSNDFREGVYLVADAGRLTVDGDVRLSATGLAGSGATGGVGTGGIGYVLGNNGPLTVNGTLAGSVDGFGGDALSDEVVGGGNGGLGTGGSLQIGTFAQNGTNGSVALQDVTATAGGLGGTGGDGLNGAGGRGGDGIAGGVFATADGSSGALSTGTLFLAAEGAGGDGGDGAPGDARGTGFAGGAGGNGTGGNTQIGTISGANLAPNTGSASFGAATLFADGIGGMGGDGGAGAEGVAGTAPNQAGGNGGNGGAGGVGGIGTGGFSATLSRGTPLTADSVLGLIIGLGGDGGAGGDAGSGGAPGAGGTAGADGATGIGGDGGAGVGGGGVLAITNRGGRQERGSATIGSMQYSTFALGGFGNSGGSTTAGEGLITILNSDATIGDLGFANNIGDAPATSPAIAIEIANGTLDVANSFDVTTGGDIALNVRDGGLLRAGSLGLFGTGSLLAVAPGGIVGTPGRIELANDFSAAFDNGFGTGASLEIGADLTVAGNVSISGDQVRLAAVSADGFLQINGQDVRTGALNGGDGVGIVTNPPEFGQPTGGGIVTGDIVSSDGPIAIVAGNGGLTSGLIGASGDVQVTAIGAVVTGNVSSGNGDVLLESLNGQVTAANVGADNISIEAQGGIQTGNLVAATAGYRGEGSGILSLSATAGAIRTGDATGVDIIVRQGDGGSDAGAAADVAMQRLTAERVTIIGRGSVTLGDVNAFDMYPAFAPVDGLQSVYNAGGSLQIGDVASQDALILNARGGAITAGRLTTPTSAVILTPFNVTLGSVTTGTRASDLLYVSNTGFSGYDDGFRINGQAFDTSQLFQASLGATDGATFQSGPITTGTLRAAAQFMTFADITAAARVDLFGTRSAAFNSTVNAPDILVDSGDIVIGDTGRIGNGTTTDLRLRAVIFNTPVVIGGDSGAGGYHLSNAEAQRLRARNIDIEAVRSGEASAPVAMIVRNLALTGSAGGEGANLVGDAASLQLRADGIIRVEGGVALRNMAETDRLSVNSAARVEIATDQGGEIVLTGADTASLGGRLGVNAPVVVAGSASLLQQVAADPNFIGRDALLATSASQARPQGFLQARTMSFTVSDLLAIQNSGSATLAAGFTAGAGGMTIQTAESPRPRPAQVSIWGRTQQADGSFLTNRQTIGAITFQSSANEPFDPPPLVNGCRLGVACGGDGGNDGPVTQTPGQIVTTVAAIEKILTTDVAEALVMPEIRFVQVVDQDGLVTEQLITEPVSGAGNSSLWQDDDAAQGGTQ